MREKRNGEREGERRERRERREKREERREKREERKEGLFFCYLSTKSPWHFDSLILQSFSEIPTTDVLSDNKDSRSMFA